MQASLRRPTPSSPNRARSRRAIQSRRARRAVALAYRTARASLRSEDARLREHFRGALRELAAADTRHLSTEQRAARDAATEALRGYAARGRFPRNDRFPGVLVPFFIDDVGTRCAVAHLVERSGRADLAREVHQRHNNALVWELAKEPGFASWAAANGLTLAELARIQPSYCDYTHADECICSSEPVQAVLEAKVEPGRRIGTVLTIYGESTLAIGDEVSLDAGDATKEEGDVVLVTLGPSTTPIVRARLDPAAPDRVDVTFCTHAPPALQKSDLVRAFLATAGGDDDASACSESLTTVNEYWGTSACEDVGECCAIGSPASGPFAFTALALGAALWMQRRRAGRARSRQLSRRVRS